MAAETLTGEIKKRSGWSIFMGVITAILGVFLMAYPLATATITTVFLGWTLALVGVAQFVFALHSQTPGNFFLKLLAGVLYGITGLVLALVPLAGVEALTGLLGVFLLAQAVLATALAFRVRPLEGWGWFLFDAAASLALGLLILFRWPSSSAWAIGTLIGVAVLMGGVSRTVIAIKARSGVNRVDQVVQNFSRV